MMEENTGEGIWHMDLLQVREIIKKQDSEKTLYFTRKAKIGYISYSPEFEDTI